VGDDFMAGRSIATGEEAGSGRARRGVKHWASAAARSGISPSDVTRKVTSKLASGTMGCVALRGVTQDGGQVRDVGSLRPFLEPFDHAGLDVDADDRALGTRSQDSSQKGCPGSRGGDATNIAGGAKTDA
jgi:hypothetical protein